MREHIKNNLMSFFIIVTLVNIAIFVCGIVLAPDEKLGYTAFIVPVIDGLLGVIPGLVMYSKRELTVKQMIVRDIIQLLSIELIIILFSFGFSGFTNVDVPKFLAIVLSVAFVYVGVVVIMYLLDFKTAKKMTDDLKAFQKSNN
ncbi:MAG: hypothetical protein SPL61_01850 [Saccharofermentans sp.]|jgi:hypothetical protein|nr:hypothetical protein [Saccharofermentans sp.]